MALAVRWLVVFALLIIVNISKTVSGGIHSQLKPKHYDKAIYHLKQSKPRHKMPDQKSSISNSGMAYDLTSTEMIKSRLDKSLGVLGPWKQNAGDLYMGKMTLKGEQEGLLNQPIRPVLSINGYPINPRVSMSLTQMTDGTLDNDVDLQGIIGQTSYPLRPMNTRSQWFRGDAPQSMGMQSRGMQQGVIDRLMFDNMRGHKREKMQDRYHVVNSSSRGIPKSVLGKKMLRKLPSLQNGGKIRSYVSSKKMKKNTIHVTRVFHKP